MQDESGQDISNFVFPTEYFPRNDLINKIILTDERIINIITNSVIKAPENSYVTASTEFLNKHVQCLIYSTRYSKYFTTNTYQYH